MQFSIVFAFALAFVLATGSPFELGRTETRPPASHIETRIVKGHDAEPGEIPYQVYLDITFPDESFFCGGSLIHSDWILTAAHCVHQAIKINVFFGNTDYTKGEFHCTVTLANVVSHALFDEDGLANDIALVNIPPLTDTSRVQIVPLPPLDSIMDKYLYENAIVAGWGQISDSPGVPYNLQVGVMQVAGDMKCQQNVVPFYPDLQMCADAPDGVATCPGDSGGALVLQSKGYQIGIVSAYPRPSCEHAPIFIFTRVTYYLYWIHYYTGIVYH